jgi:hypothetical protein
VVVWSNGHENVCRILVRHRSGEFQHPEGGGGCKEVWRTEGKEGRWGDLHHSQFSSTKEQLTSQFFMNTEIL